jgi:dihydrofolate reductase
MRRIVFGAAVSLDNFIARRDHSVDWLLWSDEAAAVTKEWWASFDAFLMGRKTYEIAAKSGGGAGGSGAATYVVSNTMKEAPKGVTLIGGEDVVPVVRELKKKEGKDICLLGGGVLGSALLEAGLVDVLGLNIHPVALGSGIPFFCGSSVQRSLELKECRTFKNGCVYVVYDVRN